MKRWRDLNEDERRAYRREQKRRLRDGKPTKRVFKGFDAVWEKLKKKHAGKPRLEKSIKPPIFLNLPDPRKKAS